MAFAAVARATLLHPTPPVHHLFIILTNPRPPQGQVLLVPVSTVRRGYDDSCVLAPGDHDFVRHESFVVYALCRIGWAAELERGVLNGVMQDRGLLDEAVFARIMAGARRSRRMKPFALELLDAE